MRLDLDVIWATWQGGMGSPRRLLAAPVGGPATSNPFQLELSCRIDAPITGVFGPSGSGKTTLLSLIAGLQKPDRGRVSLDGATLFDSDTGVDVPAHLRRIAVVFQDGRLFPHLSVRGNLLFGRRRHGEGSRLDDVVQILALRQLLHRDVRSLSGGERQRVALGRALLSGPRLLLLDEPLASLDVAARRQVLPYLRRVAETTGVPMLYVSHEIGEILQLTSQLLVLENGRLIGQGPLHEVVTEPRVFGLAAGTGLENVLQARVHEHLRESGLTRLTITGTQPSFPGPEMLGPPVDAPIGSTLTLAIRPEDVAISLTALEGVSIQNQIRGTVTRETDVAGRGIVEVDIGARLLVEVSLRSVHALRLEPGQVVHCLFKAHAIRYLDA
jgi:molybdate transport system ATP-binding protein